MGSQLVCPSALNTLLICGLDFIGSNLAACFFYSRLHFCTESYFHYSTAKGRLYKRLFPKPFLKKMRWKGWQNDSVGESTSLASHTTWDQVSEVT